MLALVRPGESAAALVATETPDVLDARDAWLLKRRNMIGDSRGVEGRLPCDAGEGSGEGCGEVVLG